MTTSSSQASSTTSTISTLFVTDAENSTTSSTSLTTTSSVLNVLPIETSTSTTTYEYTTSSTFAHAWPTQTAPAIPVYNSTTNLTYSTSNTSACDATPPSQMLQNPSFECTESGWTLDEVEIVWGSVSTSNAPPSKHRKRDTSSTDSAYDGKGFARFQPYFEGATATLSQKLPAPATNGSYWYSFAYRVPPTADTPSGCTLTVANDEDTIATIRSLGTATAWTMTGKEFTVEIEASTFSFVFSCEGIDTAAPMLDIDNIKMGLSSGKLDGRTERHSGCVFERTCAQSDGSGVCIQFDVRCRQRDVKLPSRGG